VFHSVSRPVVALFLALAATIAAPAADPLAKPPTKEQIAAWIKGLASDSFEDRENASKSLWNAGKSAEAALRQVLKSGDPEAVRRAREILNKFDWGLYPDTPPAIVALIEEYRSADHENRAPLVGKFLDQGSSGHRALMKIAAMEKDPQARSLIWQSLSGDMPRLAAALLAEGADARLDEALQQALSGEGDLPHTNYAAYLLATGKLDARLRDLQKKAGANPDKKTALTLAFLCRAKGDLPAARKYAETAEHPRLLETILAEQGDWKALLNHIDNKTPMPEERYPRIGLRLACLRLMGDRDGFTAELNKATSDEKRYIPLSAFLLNSRPDEAFSWLMKNESHWWAAHLLGARQRLRQALAVADQMKAEEPASYRSIKPYMLAFVGERKQALAEFEKLQTEAKRNERLSASPIVSEYEAGFRDEAFAHAVEMLPTLEQQESFGMIGQMLGAAKREMPVELWWRFLRDKFPADDGKTRLKRLRDLYEHKASPKEITAWLKEMADQGANLKGEQREGTLALIVHTCRDLGRDDLIDGYLEKWAAAGAGTRAWMMLGDRSAERKRWKEAAECYRHAWEKDRSAALPLYLRGRALAQAGEEKEGRRWMEIAEMMPLGSEDKLATFAGGLTDHGLMDAAGRAWERLSRLALFPSIYHAAAARGMAEKALAARDYLKAGDWTRRESLNFLSTSIYESAYLHVWLLAAEHRYRARGLAAAGKLDDMNKEIEAALAIDPNLDLGIDVVNELAKSGHKKEAGALFVRIYGAQDGLCKDFPKSGMTRNNTAWLAARCRRNLDAALEHARQATELNPDIPGHFDTLAEVLFQRGEKDKAIEAMKKAVAMEPTNAYFRNQVKRMQAGDRDADLPRGVAEGTWMIYRFRGVIP
jgi:tetratricopeptide (TPR) repeat protein